MGSRRDREKESQMESQEQKDIEKKGQRGDDPLFTNRRINKIIRCTKRSIGMHTQKTVQQM